MGKIRYSIYLYRNHDLDLITFMENHEFNFIKAVYCALTAFSNDDVFVITVPPRRSEKVINRYVYQRQLVLDTEIDAKAIDVLSKIADGYRNNFLKNLLRQYLCNPISDDYLKNKENADFFSDKFEMFKENKRFANAGLIKRKKAYDSVLLALDEAPVPEKKASKRDKVSKTKEKTKNKPAERNKSSKENSKDAGTDNILSDALSFIDVM